MPKTDPGYGKVMRTPGATGQAMSGFLERADYPLFVVTTATEDEVSGCLAGFVTQCSIEPPRFVVCISKQNHTFRLAEQAEALALHLLGEDQEELASLFGELSGDVADKFTQCAWHRGITGSPLLEQCSAWVEGRILDHSGVGDHEAFVMSVVDGGPGTHQGQLTYRQASWLQAGHPPDDATTVRSASTKNT